MITTDIGEDGSVTISSESDVCGNQVFRAIPYDDFVELIIEGRHHYVTREALAELAVQFNAITGS